MIARNETAAPYGALTGVLLNDTRCLTLPFASDPFGRMRPRLNKTAMEMSLELAYMTYGLDLEPWMRAGWFDASIQIDNQLQSGVTVGESESTGGERFQGIKNAWKLTRAKLALKEYNPFSQVFGAIRQRRSSDTIKAVTMLHRADGGRYVVAIGFMGTGSRFYDWISNFRFTAENGFHKGFQQLTEYFEDSAERILFPVAAEELGLERLSLADVIAELKSPNSRFSLWMAGHSQGGAVMQVFCHHLLHEWGAAPQNMVGYGFASPTVCVGGLDVDPAAYPLYHIVNSDDLVPCIGAVEQLGLGLRYQANDAMRDAVYGWSDAPDEVELRADAERLMSGIEDTATMLMHMAAAGTVILQEKTEENLNELMERKWSIAPLDRAFSFAGGKLMDQLTRFIRYTKVAHRSITGVRMDEAELARLAEDMRPIIRKYPLKKLFGGMRERYYPPHAIERDHRYLGSYSYIVRRGSAALKPYIWADEAGRPPYRVYADGFASFGGTPERISVKRRRAPARVHARRSARSRGVSAARVRREHRYKGE